MTSILNVPLNKPFYFPFTSGFILVYTAAAGLTSTLCRLFFFFSSGAFVSCFRISLWFRSAWRGSWQTCQQPVWWLCPTQDPSVCQQTVKACCVCPHTPVKSIFPLSLLCGCSCGNDFACATFGQRVLACGAQSGASLQHLGATITFRQIIC